MFLNDGDEKSDEDGYDSDIFLDKDKAEDFKCPICTCVCNSPFETQPCGHLYCKGCLESYLKGCTKPNGDKEKARCVVCREDIEETLQSRFLTRKVLGLRVKCKNFDIDDGCEWKGDLKHIKEHIKNDCNYQSIKCTYCKNIKYLRKNEKEHFNECLLYPLQCNLCKTKIERKSYENHIEKLCPNLLKLCTNGCNKKIKQSKMKKHVETKCKCRTIDCLYSSYGCKIKPKYMDRKIHLTQHQIVHLELKVLYLERLAQSAELLSVSNLTGIYPEISGMYERESAPYCCRPVWRHKNRKTFLVRYDHQLRGWIIDTKEYEGDIVAVRIGEYPTAHSRHIDPKHILETEKMLISDDGDNKLNDDDDNESDSDDDDGDDGVDNDDEKEKQNDVIHPLSDVKLNDNNDDEKVNVDEKPKKIVMGLFADGLWHVQGNLEFSKIKVIPYTQREFDLEWEFKSLAAQMRRHRSGQQSAVLSMNYVVSCICGKGMSKIKYNPYNTNDIHSNCLCNICENTVMYGTEFYHCPSKQMAKHTGGYDLCLACGEARYKTQNTEPPSCLCNAKMVATMSFNAYPSSKSSRVSCNECGLTINGAIWHCTKRSKSHALGWDLCLVCGPKHVSKKGGVMSWFSK